MSVGVIKIVGLYNPSILGLGGTKNKKSPKLIGMAPGVWATTYQRTGQFAWLRWKNVASTDWMCEQTGLRKSCINGWAANAGSLQMVGLLFGAITTGDTWS